MTYLDPQLPTHCPSTFASNSGLVGKVAGKSGYLAIQVGMTPGESARKNAMGIILRSTGILEVTLNPAPRPGRIGTESLPLKVPVVPLLSVFGGRQENYLDPPKAIVSAFDP